jgi:hypothetical protein
MSASLLAHAVPELAEATIGSDGFVLCPNTHLGMYVNWGKKCTHKQNVNGKPGQYICQSCGNAFLAVAANTATA